MIFEFLTLLDLISSKYRSKN